MVNNLALLKVHLGNATSSHRTEITYGSFGYCVTDTANDNEDYCTGRHVGYNATGILSTTDATSFSHATRDSTNALTNALVLHPVVLAMAFVSFLLALGAGFIGSLLAACVSLLTLAVTIVVLVIDFVLFAVLRDHVNSSRYDTAGGSHAEYGVAIWTLLAAAVCLLLGAMVVFLTCCSSRRQRKREHAGVKSDYGVAAGAKRRRWGRN